MKHAWIQPQTVLNVARLLLITKPDAFQPEAQRHVTAYRRKLQEALDIYQHPLTKSLTRRPTSSTWAEAVARPLEELVDCTQAVVQWLTPNTRAMLAASSQHVVDQK